MKRINDTRCWARLSYRTDHVYFAHSMSDYGTFWEAEAMMAINDRFGQPIMNPAQRQFERGWQSQGMQLFDTFFIPRIDTLVFTSFPDYSIGSGVGYEVNTALKAGKDVYQMSRKYDDIFRIIKDPIDYLTRIETRERIKLFSEKF